MAICAASTLLCTNTSALDIDQIAAAAPSRPHMVMGMHFFSPANVMRLVENVRAARECYKERCEKARHFNEMIEATKSELTMSDAECRNIICLLVEKQGTLTVFEAVDIVLDNSRNYPSTDQAHAMIHAFNPDDDGIPGETCYKWGSFGDWMASFMLNNRPCAFRREKVYVQPPFNVLGMPGYSATYYGLDWTQTYTYAVYQRTQTSKGKVFLKSPIAQQL